MGGKKKKIKKNKKKNNSQEENNNKQDNSENVNNSQKSKKNNNNSYKPKGLVNLGLSCYMNSILQCFFHINKLRDFFISNKNKFDAEKQPISKGLSEIMYELKYGNRKSFKPTKFKEIIADKNPLFIKNKAGDAKDLFFNLIDGLLDELSDINSKEPSNSEEIDLSNKIDVYNETKKEVDENNIINQIFIGFYETIYKCPKTNEHIYSFQVESFILFELENIKKFYNSDELTLDLCFQFYKRKQENSSFFCNLCKTTQTNKSVNGIYSPPKILTIILDRGHGKTFKGTVEFDKEINIKKYIDKSNKKGKIDFLYKLICICTHTGDSSSKGHYTSCCLNENGKFYYFSDEYVEEIKDENELYDDEPYILFYQKIENDNDNNENDIKMENLSNNLINNNENNNTINNNKINIIDEKEKQKTYNFKGARKKYMKRKNKTEEDKKENIEKEKNENDENDGNDLKYKYKEINNIQNQNQNLLMKNNQIEENISESIEYDERLINKYYKYKNSEKEKETKNNIDKNNNNDLKKINNKPLNDTGIKNKKIENIKTKKQKALIQEVLNLFMEESNEKYNIKYYPNKEKEKDPLIWKLIIKGPPNSFYEDLDIIFKIDFKSLEFEYLSKLTYIKTKILHLNFYTFLEKIPFKYKYDSNLSFYQNLKKYFDFLYELFIHPNTDDNTDNWIDEEKLIIYNEYPDEYKKFAKDPFLFFNNFKNN